MAEPNISEHNIVRLDPHNIITKDNKLIEAKYTLTKSEAQLIFTVISQIDPIRDDEFKSYRINVDEFMKFMNIRTKDAFGRIETVVDRLQQNILKIKTDPNSTKYTKVGWIMAAEYNPDKREIYLKLHNDLKPFLLGLKERFTSYRLEYVIALRSVFSIRLYELLKQYENSKHRTRYITLEELKDKLEIKGNYKTYGMFKKRILVVAKDEINKKTDINFDFIEITNNKENEKGRKKIIGLKFCIETKNKIENDISLEAEKKESKQLLSEKLDDKNNGIELLINAGISKKEAEKIIEKEFNYLSNLENTQELIENGLAFREYLLSKINLLEAKLKAGEVSNPAGWLKEAIKNNYVDMAFESKIQLEQKSKENKQKLEREKLFKNEIKNISEKWDILINELHQEYLRNHPEAINAAYEDYRKENNGEAPFIYEKKLTPEENYKANSIIRSTFDYIIQTKFNQATIDALNKKQMEIKIIQDKFLEVTF